VSGTDLAGTIVRPSVNLASTCTPIEPCHGNLFLHKSPTQTESETPEPDRTGALKVDLADWQLSLFGPNFVGPSPHRPH
jgi:hypothetical protein